MELDGNICYATESCNNGITRIAWIINSNSRIDNKLHAKLVDFNFRIIERIHLLYFFPRILEIETRKKKKKKKKLRNYDSIITVLYEEIKREEDRERKSKKIKINSVLVNYLIGNT